MLQFAVVFACLFLVFATPSHAQYFKIAPAHTDKCIDVPQSSKQHGTAIIQWHCTGNPNQAWEFRYLADNKWNIVSKLNGLCLDVPRSSVQSGEAIIQWPCTGNPNQQFVLKPSFSPNIFQIWAVHSKKCLDIANNSQQAGAQLIQWDCKNERDPNSSNQRFSVFTE